MAYRRRSDRVELAIVICMALVLVLVVVLHPELLALVLQIISKAL